MIQLQIRYSHFVLLEQGVFLAQAGFDSIQYFFEIGFSVSVMKESQTLG